MRCPICEREFDPKAPEAAKPFCSARCRTIDLGRWLGEDYGFESQRLREGFDAGDGEHADE